MRAPLQRWAPTKCPFPRHSPYLLSGKSKWSCPNLQLQGAGTFIHSLAHSADITEYPRCPRPLARLCVDLCYMQLPAWPSTGLPGEHTVGASRMLRRSQLVHESECYKACGPHGGASGGCDTQNFPADWKALPWGLEPEPCLGCSELFYWGFYCLLLKPLSPLTLTLTPDRVRDTKRVPCSCETDSKNC